MPQLMVNLDDPVDCRQAIQVLRRQLGMDRSGKDGETQNGRPGNPGHQNNKDTDASGLSLPLKLKRIQSRGMWKHLVKIAKGAEEPLSLPELDSLLDLPKNKMRSLKAIMAKLENRFDLQFLKVEADAGVDAAGNPRYLMLPNVRRQILRIVEADA